MGMWIDWSECTQIVFEGAIPLQVHADGSQLVQFPLQQVYQTRTSLSPSPLSSSLTFQYPQIELIDFGATRAYSAPFTARFFALLQSAITHDEAACINYSSELGYLTGSENPVRPPLPSFLPSLIHLSGNGSSAPHLPLRPRYSFLP